MSEELRDLKMSIVTRLSRTLDASAQRLERMSQGESVFTNDADLKATLALLKLLPLLLEQLRILAVPKLVMRCPKCGGNHYPSQCTQQQQ